MAKTTGTFGGFAFDPEVFADYMAEQPTWSDAIMASGILQDDATLMGLIGEKGNVATIPFYVPFDEGASGGAALNNDGKTNNTPVDVAGGKQTCMLIQRMKAWKAQDFTRELTGANPMGQVAQGVAGYYRQVWTRELMGIMDAVLGLSGLANHVTDLSASGSTVAEANKIDETTLIMAEQKAIGDLMLDSGRGFGLAIMHSAIWARLNALKLVNYNKYVITNAVEREVTLPTINGLIPVVSDRFTVEASGTIPVYKTFIAGRGSFLTCDKNNYEKPYYTDYDPETKAGVEKLYTKAGKVLHPNGISILAENIVEESPTSAELATSANWSLKFNEKNIRLGLIKSNG